MKGKIMFLGNNSAFDKFIVGFDSIAETRKNMLEAIQRSAQITYPPYNIRKTADNNYVVEIAAAGFSLADFDITLDEDVLSIKCSPPKDDESTFLYRGLTSKSWQRDFVLNDNVVVKDASLFNGMLKIFLEHLVKEEKKPLKINISQPKAKDTRTLLNEDSTI